MAICGTNCQPALGRVKAPDVTERRNDNSARRDPTHSPPNGGSRRDRGERIERAVRRLDPPYPMQPVPTRSIVLLAGAGFASQAMVRVTDSLLPQIASDFATSVGAASIVVAAYSVSHGSIQLIIGPASERFGKYRTVTVMCALATVLVAVCGIASSLGALAAARFASGAAAGWIIPTSMA